MAINIFAQIDVPKTSVGHSLVATEAGFAAAVAGDDGDGAVFWLGPKGDLRDNQRVSDDSALASDTSPTIVADGCDSYVFGWTSFEGDGDGYGVAIRRVGPHVAPGPVVQVNTTTASNQTLTDLVWTGTEFVVAWEDQSSVANLGDVYVRTFDASLTPTSAEIPLAVTANIEGDARLTTFAGSWAAAWREVVSAGQNVVVSAGGSTWRTTPFQIGVEQDEHIAFIDLDATHLLVVIPVADTTNGADRLEGTIVDTTQPGATLARFPIGTTNAAERGQTHPSLARDGTSLWLAWGSHAQNSPTSTEQVWFKPLAWDATAGAVDVSQVEMLLPRHVADNKGEQLTPALAPTLGPTDRALGAIWVIPSVGSLQLIGAEIIPTPVLRKAIP